MYKQVHEKHLIPGLNLVDDMSQISGTRELGEQSEKQRTEMQAILEEKKKALKNYASSAQTGIHDIVKAVSHNLFPSAHSSFFIP